MDCKKQIIKICFISTIIMIQSSCMYLPREQFNVINKNDLDEYCFNDVVIQFHLIFDTIYTSEKEYIKNNLARNGWALNVYRKEGSNKTFRINKIIIKTSDYEIDLEDAIYDSTGYKQKAELTTFRSLEIFDQNNFQNKETFKRLKEDDYEISRIRSRIMYLLPKDKKLNIIVDIDIIKDNEYENNVFIYTFEIKKRKAWFYLYA